MSKIWPGAIAASILLFAPTTTLSKTPPSQPATPARATDRSDRDIPTCYVQNPDGTIQDLSRLCGQKPAKKRVPVKADKIPICYGLDDQYFPCPSDES
jgi:hypothetical protein